MCTNLSAFIIKRNVTATIPRSNHPWFNTQTSFAFVSTSLHFGKNVFRSKLICNSSIKTAIAKTSICKFSTDSEIPSRSKQLKDLLQAGNPNSKKGMDSNSKIICSKASPSFLMEAHNGISAKIVEEAGFRGVWASGLSMSASFGARDANELSWTQIVEIAESMADSCDVPILLDGDTGFGSFNNFQRLVYKLEQRGIAGVAIEDKMFPKRNSFIQTTKQEKGIDAEEHLCPVDEFCGKIKAVKDHQLDSDFVVAARCEGFIMKKTLEETLYRCEMYVAAGADALIVHSKRNDGHDIFSFLKHWDMERYGHIPIIVIPTMFPNIPVSTLHNAGVSTVIWANHNLRASIYAMQKTSAHIFKYQSTESLQTITTSTGQPDPKATLSSQAAPPSQRSTTVPTIVSLHEVFRLQDVDGLKQNEMRYESYMPTSLPK